MMDRYFGDGGGDLSLSVCGTKKTLIIGCILNKIIQFCEKSIDGCEPGKNLEVV